VTSRYDELSPRARWFMENFDELDLADICATQEAAKEKLEAELAARDAALAAYTAQLVHDQQRLARVRRLADQWQAATRPGERHPAAAAIHRALEADDDGPSVAECAADDVRWDLEKEGS
jgi:hypothetical protein